MQMPSLRPLSEATLTNPFLSPEEFLNVFDGICFELRLLFLAHPVLWSDITNNCCNARPISMRGYKQ